MPPARRSCVVVSTSCAYSSLQLRGIAPAPPIQILCPELRRIFMFDRLDQLEARYEELGRQLSDPKIVNDQENYRKVSKAYRDMEPTVEKFREYRKIKDGIAEAKAMLADADPDVNAMAQEELALLEPQMASSSCAIA